MITKAKTKIVVETYQRQVIRFRRRPTSVFCQFCQSETELLERTFAALILDMTVSKIVLLIDLRRIHFCKIGTGGFFICLKSLQNFKNKMGER